MEPSEARRLLLLSLAGERGRRVAGRFSEIDTLLRVGKKSDAIELADRLFLREGLGLSKTMVSEMNVACENLKMLRLPRHEPTSLAKIA